MGEIADMILDGLLDEETGELIDGTAPGYPRRMSEMHRNAVQARQPRTHKCPTCKRKFRGDAGLAQHRAALNH